MDEYNNYNQETIGTQRNVVKSQNYNKSAPEPKNKDVPNKDNQILTYYASFENQATVSVSEMKTTPAKKQDSRPTMIKSNEAENSISNEDIMQHVTEKEEENIWEKSPTVTKQQKEPQQLSFIFL